MQRMRMSGRWRWQGGLALVALVCAAISAWHLCHPAALPQRSAAGWAHLDLTYALASDQAGFSHALKPRVFSFPADQGPHPQYRTEWWYWTGNLETDAHRRFGYQYTLFRVALAPQSPARTQRASAWASDQVYFAHLALSDPQEGVYHVVSDEVRGAVGLAGAQSDPFRVWIGGWQVMGWNPAHLQAASRVAQGFSLDLLLSPGKPVVLEGDHGLSEKGGGGASYYYSFTRMPTRGEVTVAGDRSAVHGESWMDREWSTTALSAQQSGWDWFSLQLDDGRDLMLYRMRLRGGGIDPASSGTLVAVDGSASHLSSSQFSIASTSTWESPLHDRYPSRWRVRVPAAGIDCEVVPIMPNQELDVGIRYWEGAVDVSGGSRGRGYVELTGYDQLHPLEAQP
jgi:predicted secreted hydrolase